MHTHRADGGTVFHHNGDYSGELVITVPVAAEPIQGPFGGTVWRVEVPFADVRELVFAYLRARKIEQIEQASDAAFEAILLDASSDNSEGRQGT